MTAHRRTPIRRRVLVITGSRAEFGLLRPVMDAIRTRRSLELLVCVAGEHLLAPALTWREVAKHYRIDAKVPMQRPRDRGRLDHAAATGRGLTGFAAAYKKLKPDWVVVLGDRIEAFAAASAASIAGIAVCHIHGGDRAEGIADEAMRHAITKLAHLHCAATNQSAERIIRMGESKQCVFVTGSPAIDGLRGIKAMGDSEATKYGDPRTIILLHPSGMTDWGESVFAMETKWIAESRSGGVLLLAPNHDPGRQSIVSTHRAGIRAGIDRLVDSLPRPTFLALLKRIARLPDGVLLGNSSAGLIECAALGVPVVNLGPRQRGRESASNALTWAESHRVFPVNVEFDAVLDRIDKHIRNVHARRGSHPYGSGRAGEAVARLLARIDPSAEGPARKRISY